jgi:hypothetical protein
VEKHLAGEGVVSRVQRRKLVCQLGNVSITGESVEQDLAGDRGVLGSRLLAGGHTPTVRHESAGRRAALPPGTRYLAKAMADKAGRGHVRCGSAPSRPWFSGQ